MEENLPAIRLDTEFPPSWGHSTELITTGTGNAIRTKFLGYWVNPPVNKRDLSTGENGENEAKRGVTRAREFPSAGSPVNGARERCA